MLISEASPDSVVVDASIAYWAAIVAIVPVLALALIVEARRSISKTEVESVAYRRFLSFYPAVNVILLALVFNKALVALAAGSPAMPWSYAVNTILMLVFLAGILEPFLTLVLRSNPDALIILRQVLPFSSWRRQRRQQKRIVRLTGQVLGQILETIELQEEALRLIRLNMATDSKKRHDELTKLIQYLRSDASGVLEPELAAKMKSDLAAVEMSETYQDWQLTRVGWKKRLRRQAKERRQAFVRLVQTADAYDEAIRELRGMVVWRVPENSLERISAQTALALEELRAEQGVRVTLPPA